MKKVAAVVSKPDKPTLREIAPQVINWLKERGYKVVVDKQTAEYVSGQEVVAREKLAEKKPGFVIVLGGDGTMLSAARAVAEARIPILGVNLGSLGFLTEVPLEEVYKTLDAIDCGKCAVESRAMLRCELIRRGKRIGRYDALNDAVINKSHIARLTDFDVIIDDAFVSNYKADGLIIATPTGSTAYSLAAGGPIVLPNVEAFLITPVSPHALTNRPLVVRESAQITVVVKGAQEEAFLSIDGQVGTPLRDGDRIACSKSEFRVDLMKLPGRTFFDVLRTKLSWGVR
jgi:NAD+ kinase